MLDLRIDSEPKRRPSVQYSRMQEVVNGKKRETYHLLFTYFTDRGKQTSKLLTALIRYSNRPVPCSSAFPLEIPVPSAVKTCQAQKIKRTTLAILKSLGTSTTNELIPISPPSDRQLVAKYFHHQLLPPFVCVS